MPTQKDDRIKYQDKTGLDVEDECQGSNLAVLDLVMNSSDMAKLHHDIRNILPTQQQWPPHRRIRWDTVYLATLKKTWPFVTVCETCRLQGEDSSAKAGQC